MRYTLHDYQEGAVRDVLRNLEKARVNYKQLQNPVQFSLTATTGAGKTVMAAAVIEALFFGSDEYNFHADPGAVVLWFSDDPSLNHQSRIRLQAAASELDNRLRVIDTDFAETKFEPGNVYFLNTQKLSKNSRLVKGEPNAEAEKFLRPDLAQTSIYDVIRNTVTDPNLTLYMVLDEAHRGMGTDRNDKERSTIVQRLINGQNGVPPMPIVWGISATVQRFQKAMEAVKAEGRTALPSIQVDAERVQASGLLKDDIVLSIPEAGGSGTYDFILLRRAVDKIKASSTHWDEYTQQQGEKPVNPLLVVQVADKATGEDLWKILKTIYEQWPELPNDSVAHVFGDHRPLPVGPEIIPYIAPEQVQDTRRIRVLLAKSAISTGWDCPRAEVLVSFRPAQDDTHITQLLGRMMRTPLARRIPKNQVLNSVECLLPFFDRQTAQTVAQRLTRGATSQDDNEGSETGRRVLFDPIEVQQNKALNAEIWTFFESLPTMILPRKDVKPIRRLATLASYLSKDNLKPGAVKEAADHLHAFLDQRVTHYSQQLERAKKNVLTMKGEEMRAKLGGAFAPMKSFEEDADPRAIEASFQAATRLLSEALSKSYANHLAGIDTDDDGLLDARIQVAAIGLIPELVRDVEYEADRIARAWLEESRGQRKGLPDSQQANYTRLEAQSTQPERVNLVVPISALTETQVRNPDGSESKLPTYKYHLLCDEEGLYPTDLNGWEQKVLEQESKTEGFIGWYRNPSRAQSDSVAVPYTDPTTGDWKPMRPDFLFFSQETNGQLVADLVDPHGYHLTDALPKLQGLVKFTEKVGDSFRRIEAVAEVNGTYWKLDMKQPTVRKAVLEATDAKALYLSELAKSY